MTEITPTECRRLRELAKLRDSLAAVSDETDYEYRIVYNHIRGLCNHDDLGIDPLPPTEERHGKVSEEECAEMRDLYFDERYTMSEIANQFNCSKTTVLRHIRYRCSHHLPTDQAWGGHTPESVGVDTAEPDWPDKSTSESLTEVTTRNYPSNFREVAISRFDGRGLISGIQDHRLLEVAHILSWSEYPDHRFDPGNILVLSQLHHAAFDSHLFTFDTDYRLHVDPKFNTNNPLLISGLLEREGSIIEPPGDELMDEEYIKKHNKAVKWWPPED